MTRLSSQLDGMVLAPAERASGEVSGGFAYSSDVRVPSRLPRADWEDRREPQHVGWIHRTERCLDGRHVFDVIESTIEHEIEDEDARDGYRYEVDFRARLTCLRCGLVLAWEGRRTEDRHVATLDPVPLVAGDLVAQMVHSDRIGRQDWSRYEIYRFTRAGYERVGSLMPMRGQRGREYHVGQLDAWGQGQYVEGKDAAAALRAVVRRERRAAAVAS